MVFDSRKTRIARFSLFLIKNKNSFIKGDELQ